MAKEFVLYGLFDPDTDDLRYVGLTYDWKGRKRMHEKMKAERGSALDSWFEELRAKNQCPAMRTIATIKAEQRCLCLYHAMAEASRLLEKNMIERYSQYYGEPLLNVQHNPSRKA